MHKKGGGTVFWYVISILLGVAIAVWFFSGPFSTLLYGAEKTKEKTTELFKSWSEYNPFEQKKLETEDPKQVVELELKEIKQKYANLNLLSLEDLTKLKEKALSLKEKFDSKYKNYVSEQQRKDLDEIIGGIDTKISRLEGGLALRQEELATVAEEEEKKIENAKAELITPEELAKYEELKNEFDSIMKYYYTPTSYNYAIEKFELLKEKIKKSDINKKLFNWLDTETVLRILSSYSKQQDCKKTEEIYLEALKIYYPTSIGILDLEHSVVSRGYYYVLDCYFYKFKMESNLDRKREIAYKLLDIGDEFYNLDPSYYDLMDSKKVYDTALFYLAKADCSKANNLDKCHSTAKDITVKNYKEGKSFLYQITESAVEENKNLGCYWDLNGGNECISCSIIGNYNSCKDYDTEEICREDPCAIGFCQWDNGGSGWDLGLMDSAGCCNGEPKC